MQIASALRSRARRPLAGLTSSALVLSTVVVASALATGTAQAAILGAVTVSPTSGTDATLFNGSVNANCPVGTTESTFLISGPDITEENGYLGAGNNTGTGANSFTGASILNLRSTAAGSFAASGAYTIRFTCFGASSVTDSYNATMNYTFGGAGSWTIASTASAPGAPTGVTATPGAASANVSWSAPASDGGSAVTGYTVTATPTTGSPVVATVGLVTSTTVSGLTNGTTYAVTVKATNAIGTGLASSPAASVTPAAPATAPAAPVGVTATAGDTTATVSWTAPDNGGSPITSYTVTSSPGGLTATGGSAPLTVTGLLNGTSYSFTVVATNTVGTGPASVPSNSVTPAPATAPEAPTGVVADSGNARALISWVAPGNGGSPVTGYTVVVTGSTVTGDTEVATTTTKQVTGTSTVVGSLVNGTAYTVTVRAKNAVGTGPASGPVTVTPAPIAATAPTGVVGTAGNAQASVSWTAPSDNGGSALTGYVVTATPPTGAPVTKSTSATSTVVTGLLNGTTYGITVQAVNGVGTSAASSPARSVTPKITTSTALFSQVSSVVSGTAVRISGKVTGLTGTHLVTLRTYNDGLPASDRRISSSNGAFAVNVTATYNATYRVFYLGDAAHTASTSNAQRTLAKTRITISRTSASGRTITVTGAVYPAIGGAIVTLVEYRSTGVARLLNVRTASNGTFVARVTLAAGTHSLQVVSAAYPKNAAGASARVSIRTV